MIVLGGVAATGRWLIAAWQKSIVDQRNSPASTTVIVDGAVDVVEVLRTQLANMTNDVNSLQHQLSTVQQELANVKALLIEVERQRDEWKARAVNLGWVDP